MGFLYFSGRDRLAVAAHDLVVAVAEQLSLSAVEPAPAGDAARAVDPRSAHRPVQSSLSRGIARTRTRARLRRSLPLAVLMVDLDHFKRFNDTHGHDGGDALLSQVGRLLQSQSRAEDIACRFGGEEFTLILPEMDAHGALERAQRVHELVEGLQVWHLRETLTPVTASIGLACCPGDARAAPDLLRLADVALHRAKREGRNRVVRASDIGEA